VEQVSNLASAVRETYASLQDETPAPLITLRPLHRRTIGNEAVLQTRYEVMSDGVADGNLGDRRQRYPLTALAIAIDCYKVSTTCRYAESLVAEGRTLPLFQLRVSTEAVMHPEFLDFLLHEVSESGIGTDRLWFELTDSVRLREDDDAAYFCSTLRSIGCQISVAEVHPKRGSTAVLQKLKPHTLALDSSLWPVEPEDQQLAALHQTISDLHHLVGEHVVLRDDHDGARAQQLGIDFIETFEAEQLLPEQLRDRLPAITR
jgi:EAL domain-containing protein (putative c-di-GMP-specific phosphodiesterase class I)